MLINGKEYDVKPGADLSGANLSRANLSRADLSGADLSGANLSRANLSRANLYHADLSGADLYRADLSGADLYRADLSRANLSRADMSRANLSRADLSGANLSGAQGIPAIAAVRLEIVPRNGHVTGWKKCLDNVLVRVMVPHGVPRSNATGRQCRAAYVYVQEVVGAKDGRSWFSDYGQAVYRKGQIVRAHEWCEDRWQECAGGIHFFLTREEAEAYQF